MSGNGHLLALAVGPVQEFIASARRTRDLWCGSNLLSRMSRAAAEAVVEQKGKLIFPPLGSLRGNVANVILAELKIGLTPKDIAAAAGRAAAGVWEKEAGKAYNVAPAWVRKDIWDDQVGDVVEFYAAWLELEPSQYPATRAKLMRLLAGRKACRNFKPAKGRALVPKSSLDGARESVIILGDRAGMPVDLQRRLRLSDGEHLDVVGWTKRLGGGLQVYPSLMRIAADPWLWGVAHATPAPDGWAALLEAGEELKAEGSLGRIGWKRFNHFPFEGALAYATRHKELAKETQANAALVKRAGEALARIKRDGFGEPEAYLAVIAADGDAMGKTIAGLKLMEQHRDFSKDLAEFAGRAEKIVEQHYGALVFSGGDDVLALVPVDLALECARALHDTFGDLMKVAGVRAGTKPTLSVGVAIGHAMDPMEDLLDRARAAERRAKHSEGEGADRDGLCVTVHPRSGAPLGVRTQWQDLLDENLLTWARLLREGKLPQRAAYHLRRLAADYENWKDTKAAGEAMRADAVRMLRRKRGTGGAADTALLEELLAHVEKAENLVKLGDRVLVARRVARGKEQAGNREAAR